MIEGSGAGSGSVPRTIGYGSGKPKTYGSGSLTLGLKGRPKTYGSGSPTLGFYIADRAYTITHTLIVSVLFYSLQWCLDFYFLG
jgi:hypothetical protein